MRITLLPLFLAVGLLTGCGSKPHQTGSAPAAAPVAVQLLSVAATEVPLVYEATGTVRARTTGVISSKVMGYARQVSFREGDRVRAGQLLVELDSRDLETQVRQAEAARREAEEALAEVDGAIATSKANLGLAQATFKRMEDLFAKKSVSNQEYDEAAARLKVAQAAYDMAASKRAQVLAKGSQAAEAVKAATILREYARITAPFDGLVVEKRVEQGDLVAPGAPLATVEQEGLYRLEAAVEESRLREIRAGQSVSVALEALGQMVAARVGEIMPSVDAASRSYIVKIDLPPVAGLRSGMFGRAVFTLGKRRAITVPATAILEQGQLRSVLVVEGGHARARMITVGEAFQDRREVLSGLNEGERIVFPLPAGIADGTPVEARP
ncbi:MAG: efflux RND transporter periplasmic adaptor subunit [Bryobacteraceae bacterium]